MYVDCLEMF